MRVFEAKDICPDIVIKPAQHDVYVQTHNKILHEVSRHVPITKVWSIDEVECTLIGHERRGAQALALRIREGLARNIGQCITPSIGLAANQFLAKVAAELNKPNGLTVLRPEALPGPLLKLNLKDLPGISGGMQKRLNTAGIVSIKDFWNISAKHARAIWGNVEGERMWAQLHGYAISRPDTTRRMFGHSRLLSGEWQIQSKAIDCLRLLTVKAAYRMRREGYAARTLSISLRHESGRWNDSSHFPSCDDDHTLSAHMQALYDRAIDRLGPRVRIRGVYVMLSNIAALGEQNSDLFDDQDNSPDLRKWGTLTRAMDSLNERHGRCVIHLGPRAKMPGGYAGAKIAFGRVPDAKDFF